MRLTNPFWSLPIADLFETLLPDFVLAFAFFTGAAYAVLGKRFDLQRPAVAMSATIGMALSVGLVWWEQSTRISMRDLGPIALGFAVLMLALVLYQAIRQVGGSWAGAGIALGVVILITKVVELRMPLDAEVLQTVTIAALIAGTLAFLLHRSRTMTQVSKDPVLSAVRHDMSDLYKDRRISKGLGNALKKVRNRGKDLKRNPEQGQDISVKLKRMLPAEGRLTERMAALRAKAHRIRNGHIARLEETRHVYSKLPTARKKQAAAKLAERYRKMIGADTRLERLDKAVAQTEQQIRELTQQGRIYAQRNDFPRLNEALEKAQKLQKHNTRLFKLIQRTENKLCAIATQVANEVKKP